MLINLGRNTGLQSSLEQEAYLVARSNLIEIPSAYRKLAIFLNFAYYKKMGQLHNRISRKELKEKIEHDPTPRTTLSFYCYFPIEEVIEFRNELYSRLKELGVLGRIYLAQEGINAQ